MQEEMKYFNTANRPILQSTDVRQWFNENVIKKFIVEMEDFQKRDFRWSLSAMIIFTVNINNYEPLRGGLLTFGELLAKIQNKEAAVHIQNLNESSFCGVLQQRFIQ